MPARTLGDQRFSPVGTNSAGDPMYARNPNYYEDISVTGAAAELAAELGVDISTVEGTGKDGNITKADVQRAASG